MGNELDNFNQQQQAIEKAAAFVEEAAKKVQEGQYNQFDFGYKSPSSSFGARKSHEEQDTTSSHNEKASVSSQKSQNTNTGSDRGLFSPDQNGNGYSAIVSNNAMDNVKVNGSSSGKWGTSNNNSSNIHIQNGTVDSYGRVQVNRQKSDTTRINVDNTGRSGPADGKFVSYNEKTGNITSSNPSQTSGDLTAQGYYNTGRHDLTQIANATVQTVKSQYYEAEPVQAKHAMRHYGTLYGFGTISRRMDKTALRYSMYNRPDASKLGSLFDSYGGNGFKYRVGNSITGNIINDHEANLRAVENYLASHNINAKNLNRVEIMSALNTGDLKHWYHKGENIKITKGSDLELALKELLHLRKENDLVKKFQKDEGGLKNTAKAWIRETYADSDVNTGYKVAKTTVGVGKAAKKTAEVAAKGTINTGITVIKKGMNTPDHARVAVSKYKLKKEQKKPLSSRDKDAIKKYQTSISNASQKITVRNNSARNAKYKVKHFNPIKNTKLKIKTSLINFREGLSPVKAFRNLQKKLRETKIGKFFGNLFSGYRNFLSAIKSIFFVLGTILVVLIFLNVILIAATSFVGGGSSSEVENTVERNAQNTMAQQTIDYLYSYQNSYTHNAYECNNTRVHEKDGSLMIEKRLPQSWFTQMSAADPWINENNASVDYWGTPAGYNLSKYWGQFADKSGLPSGADMYGKIPAYKITLLLATNEFEEKSGRDAEGNAYTYQERIYKPVTISLCGNAGLQGNAGTFVGSYYNAVGDQLKYNYYKKKTEYKVDNVDGVRDALDNWEAKDNVDLKVTYYYRGSQYSCHITGNKFSYFFNTNGDKIYYNIDEFYKAFLTMAAGVTDNADSDAESHEFYKLYSKQLFDQIMEDAKLTLTYKYIEDPTQKVTFNFRDTVTNTLYENIEVDGYKCEVNLKIFIQNCGIPDMMEEDAKVCHGEDGDTWMHTNGNVTKFAELNKYSQNYVKWLTTPNAENTLNTSTFWLMPIWGQGKNEPWDYIKTYYHSGFPSHYNKEHKYTQAMAYTVEFDNFTLEDWKASIDGLMFPSEISIANFMDEEAWNAVQSLNGVLNEEIDWENIDWSTYTTGDADLDNFLQFALSQIDIQNETGYRGLCCFTSYVMAAMFMHPEQAQMIKSNLSSLVNTYVLSTNGTFNTGSFCNNFGLSTTHDIKYAASDLKQTVSDKLESGTPMILHFTKDIYENDGSKVYGFKNGTGTHFMVVYACSDTTVTVCDPAKGGQRTMSWDAFYRAQASGGLRELGYAE